ncbi:hypothetical protein HC251_01200 [Iamia sp. SCSIO 61187]|uniref:hypothetical protein n=1 Tax=Iamia sp. SCSIO 61187 TaxID=2722752 RepID=UPI001C62B86D|nr:hypothetical protein [Iamia sp. SCSIO 61187]QYG91187.1 hypothetical protein HC251_01200 [Iamia sp. SCSIO 61187]
MTAAAPPPAGRRTDGGLYLVAQLALVFAALLWMPFGVRDATGVSNVLPALRPAPAETPRTAEWDQVTAEAVRRPAPGRPAVVVAVLVAGMVLVAARRRSVGHGRPRPSLGPRPVRAGRIGSRAPPFLR